MKLKNLALKLLLAASLLAPGAAEPGYTVTFVNGQAVVTQNQSACPDNGETYTVYNQPTRAHRGGTTTIYYSQSPIPDSRFKAVGQVEPVQPTPPQTVAAPTPNAYAAEVLRLTNQTRAQYGLAPLQGVVTLDSAALAHSQEMLDLGYFSHTSPTPGHSDPVQRARAAGAGYPMIAENIFQCEGYDAATVAQLAMENWMQSPGHRTNILRPNATHIGIGFVEKDGAIAVTQLFGGNF